MGKESEKAAGENQKNILYWNVIATEAIADCEVFHVQKTIAQSRCSRKIQSGFHTILCSNWVNVIAVTDDNKAVMVEQYRIKKIEEPKFDESGTELLHCSLVDFDQIDTLIKDGTISHSLVIVAFHFLETVKPKPS